MAKFKQIRSHLVYYVTYDYDDLELHEHYHIENYFKDLKEVANYLLDIDLESIALDNAFYKCRDNPRIKISLKNITDRLYVSLFKDQIAL